MPGCDVNSGTKCVTDISVLADNPVTDLIACYGSMYISSFRLCLQALNERTNSGSAITIATLHYLAHSPEFLLHLFNLVLISLFYTIYLFIDLWIGAEGGCEPHRKKVQKGQQGSLPQLGEEPHRN